MTPPVDPYYTLSMPPSNPAAMGAFRMSRVKNYRPGTVSAHGQHFFTDGHTMWRPEDRHIRQWYIHPAIRGQKIGDQSGVVPADYAHPMVHVNKKRFRRDDGRHVSLPLRVVRAFWRCEFTQAGEVTSPIRVRRDGAVVAYTMPLA